MSIKRLEGKLQILKNRSVRYVINGLIAAGVHFSVLTLNLKVLNWSSAGWANLIASLFGITFSFVGSRYFVFQESSEPLNQQVSRFFLLYILIAIFHGVLMHWWVDVFVLNYAIGFVVTMIVQVILSYWGNKLLVFKL
ncbi:GtrA family protein [Orrella sp. NBD-18]|uniref:GtrA family protein n=1 Tax=Sheuella amnicola TaxID=2707330 RepID=A0A6B2R026_9BURK|nr:GtrA family protein [Sheuella amnicola]NDY83503.1 GtrA family protein [Sheuella amnicola]